MTIKTAENLNPGEIVQSEQGPSRVNSVTVVDGAAVIDFTIVADGIEWGDEFQATDTFEIVEE